MHRGFIRHSRRRGFSLVELLTVIFIIGLLIAILVPSLSAARNAAKKMTTAKALDSIKVGLEMFKNENAADFPQTNGYPPSFAHPPIPGYPFDAHKGEFPFSILNDKPAITGAHWLPAMLMGPDKLGYIKRSSVPNKDNLREKPYLWYTPDPLTDGTTLSRGGPYVDVALPTKRTKDLPGRANANVFGGDENFQKIQELPVIVDAFDQTILYYVANAHGRASNMVAGVHPPNNTFPGGGAARQEEGPPFYFHEDNLGFTGVGRSDPEKGWDFGNSGARHTLALSGFDHTAVDLRDAADPDRRETFARYIVDRKIFGDIKNADPAPPPTTPLRPVNADSYLLISAGVDGKYGTNDDVSNLPPFTD